MDSSVGFSEAMLQNYRGLRDLKSLHLPAGKHRKHSHKHMLISCGRNQSLLNPRLCPFFTISCYNYMQKRFLFLKDLWKVSFLKGRLHVQLIEKVGVTLLICLSECSKFSLFNGFRLIIRKLRNTESWKVNIPACCFWVIFKITDNSDIIFLF